MIPVSVLITTYNEEKNLPRCLAALKDFDEVVVIDSSSQDMTVDIAKKHGVHVECFEWNKKYPKKRQWCLDNVKTKNDFIFFVDGDEEVTPDLVNEIKLLDFSCAGYFVKGKYIWNDKILNYGLKNNKLVLFNRNKIEFPVVDDLDIEGVGEMEGHYQPVLKQEHQREQLGQLVSALHHFAYEDFEAWRKRHDRYAAWEANMIRHQTYPLDPKVAREWLKSLFRIFPARPLIAFIHSYFIKQGFRDGRAGWLFARSRYTYYRTVSRALSASKHAAKSAAENKRRFVMQK
jgi:glycosyltransferase involved in cell wall biosynthesis